MVNNEIQMGNWSLIPSGGTIYPIDTSVFMRLNLRVVIDFSYMVLKLDVHGSCSTFKAITIFKKKISNFLFKRFFFIFVASRHSYSCEKNFALQTRKSRYVCMGNTRPAPITKNL